jgi:hypothetical protein
VKRAFLNLRYALVERWSAFAEGFARLGYTVHRGFPEGRIGAGDLFCSWNRIGRADVIARQFEEARLPVLVAENATWGNDFCGGHWLSLWRNLHNTAGKFPVGGTERWDDLLVVPNQWQRGDEVLILPQRGIGSPPVAMPSWWPDRARMEHGGRIRPHPGRWPSKPLEQDMENVGLAVTWGSGAAVKALMLGVPVQSDMPNWCGEQDNTDAGRLAMLRRLAWAQWRLDEIRSGEAFRWMLQ